MDARKGPQLCNRRLLPLPCNRFKKKRLHGISDEFNNGHHDRIAELAVGLGVGHLDAEGSAGSVETHQPGALQGGETAGALSGLVYENFRSVLVVAGRERPGHIIGSEKTESEAIPCRTVLLLVALQVLPQFGRQRIFGVNLVVWLEDAPQLRAIAGLGNFQGSKAELGRLAEPDDEDARASGAPRVPS